MHKSVKAFIETLVDNEVTAFNYNVAQGRISVMTGQHQNNTNVAIIEGLKPEAAIQYGNAVCADLLAQGQP
jgi:hypothetical protein